MKFVIIDYDAGNLRNVQKTFEFFGEDVVITNESGSLSKFDGIILPGVGAFKKGIDSLMKYNLFDALKTEILIKKKPFLGICLGMHLIADKGFEGGENDGLGFINNMQISKIDTNNNKNLRLPHIGWNNISIKENKFLFKNIPDNSDFYFVHSYAAETNDDSIVSSTVEYGKEIIASIEKDNIFATQFHPEKSQQYGLKVIKNFIDIARQF